MARYFKKRRIFRSRRLINRRRRKAIKSLLRSKKLIKKYSLPTRVKLVGMSEKKHLIIRSVQKYSVGMAGDNGKYLYQILLDPLSSPDITKVFDQSVLGLSNFQYFNYDYMRVKNIVVVLRPAMGLPSSNITVINPLGDNDMQQEPSTPIYGYYTLKMPMLLRNDAGVNVDTMFSIKPDEQRINLEGKYKSTFSFPSTQSVTLVLNSIKTRVSQNDSFIFSNKLINLQNIGRSNRTPENFFNPFSRPVRQAQYSEESDNSDDNINETKFKDGETEENLNDFSVQNGDLINVTAVNEKSSLLNFGRIILVSEKNYKFTAEIIYDCDFYR